MLKYQDRIHICFYRDHYTIDLPVSRVEQVFQLPEMKTGLRYVENNQHQSSTKLGFTHFNCSLFYGTYVPTLVNQSLNPAVTLAQQMHHILKQGEQIGVNSFISCQNFQTNKLTHKSCFHF